MLKSALIFIFALISYSSAGNPFEWDIRFIEPNPYIILEPGKNFTVAWRRDVAGDRLPENVSGRLVLFCPPPSYGVQEFAKANNFTFPISLGSVRVHLPYLHYSNENYYLQLMSDLDDTIPLATSFVLLIDH
ncbi:hypothetical protein BDF14DRAFT_1820119 [Spinellus fusiger]|nr:hypothetical protein BDF14DRAFT_1820119 [Spinellus fusiger]